MLRHRAGVDEARRGAPVGEQPTRKPAHEHDSLTADRGLPPMAAYGANAMPRPHRTGHVGEKALSAVYPATELVGAGQVSEIWMRILDFGRDDTVCSPLC